MNENNSKTEGRQEHRRASRVIFSALVVSALLLAVALLVSIMLLFFPVAEIEVEGGSRYAYGELIELSGIGEGDRLYYVDKAGAARRVLDACPYLKYVRVHTYFPYRIKIEIEEYEDIYLLRHESGFAYLSPELEILEITEAAPEYKGLSATYIRTASALSGGVGDKCEREDIRLALKLVSHIKRSGASAEISMVDVRDRYDLSFILNGRYRLTVGTSADMDEKLEAAKSVLVSESFKREECSFINAEDKKRVYVRYVEPNDIKVELDLGTN